MSLMSPEEKANIEMHAHFDQLRHQERVQEAVQEADESPPLVNGRPAGQWVHGTDRQGRPTVTRSRGGLPGTILDATPHPDLVARDEAALLTQDDAGRAQTIREVLAEVRDAGQATDRAANAYWLTDVATYQTETGRDGAKAETLARFDQERATGREAYRRGQTIARAAARLLSQAHAAEPALTDAELATVANREPHVRADIERMDAVSLATMIRSAVIRADWPALALFDRHVPTRLDAMRTPAPRPDGRVAVPVAAEALAEVDSGLRRVRDMLATRPRAASKPLPWERDVDALERQLEALARACNDHPSRLEPGRTIDGRQKVAWKS